MALTIIKGTIVSAPAPGQLDITEPGYLVAEDGVIRGIYGTLPAEYTGAAVEDFGDCLVLQTFADLHLHAPQYPMVGTGMDLTLLDWLNTYTFPAEARFADPGYARDVYRKLAAELIAHGTTRVAMFSSRHTDATLALMEELERAGVCGCVGKVNMDRNSGVAQETTEASMAETLRWLDGCRFEHVKPILTPRFTPSCSDELMAFLGELARERDLPVQSHLSENMDEIAWVRRLHPDCGRYWETYEKFGLWKEGTLMAHCVHSDEAERGAMAGHGIWAVHCAASNVNICSGTAPVRRLLEEGVRVALGSDIAGGDQLAMYQVVAASIRASKVRSMETGDRPLTVPEAFYLGTAAGQRYFGGGAGFVPGDRLHAIVVDEGAFPEPVRALTLAERFERAVYLMDKSSILAVYSDSRRVDRKERAHGGEI